jgi:glyoxylase-like metal-dependent hydrolase (beta-lactamase superfamily II)
MVHTNDMRITPIHAGHLKLDGGAMHGIVPKTLWSRVNPPDDDNLCTWAMRCLLVETGARKILIDTGLGTKQDEKFRSHFQPHGPQDLLSSLREHGLEPEEITDVLLSHLHFDHVGGAVLRRENAELVPQFPEATYWSNERHWNWALEPNSREAASFLPENILPLQHAGRLRFIDVQRDDVEWLPGITLRFLYGHTEAMMMPIFERPGATPLVYAVDLLPSAAHISMPWVMAFDVRPLATLEEKERLLSEALAGDWELLFEHDPRRASAHLRRDERGRIRTVDSV